MPTIHVVSHTHWDREWYHPAARFRQRLVSLVDELLDDSPGAGSSFLLDGQTVVINDYLSVRPGRALDLTMQLRSGALEAGPWFVLADELIPGGEALVRNLLLARRTLQALRVESPPVLYCPDSFGHPAALPDIARGFGLEMVIVWRGFGGARWPAGDACWWRAPSGARVLLYHLPPSGYELGANLPVAPEGARIRWRAMREQLVPRSRLPVVLLPNGADHHARQRGLDAALAALADAAAPVAVRPSSLRAFATEALAAAPEGDLPEVTGELRDSYGYAWTLQGTFGARAGQKRRNAQAERLLTAEAEPWAALASRRGGHSFRLLLQAAWRTLLLGHPHDTLCGCAIDEVARAQDVRLEEAATAARGVRDDALVRLIGHDVERARGARERWRPYVLLRNPAARPRAGVATVRLTRFLADVPVGPGSAIRDRPPARPALFPRIAGVKTVQVLSRTIRHERTESPRDYPDDDLVEAVEAAVWAPPVPGFGIRALPLDWGGRSRARPAHPVTVSTGAMTNGRITVRVAPDGSVEIRDEESGRTLGSCLAVEDQDDAGDLYTPSLRGPIRAGRCSGVRAVHRGPLRGTIETRWRVAVRRGQSAAVRLALSLDADSGLVRITVDGENHAADHRLRLCVRTGVASPRVHADAAFGPVERRRLEIPARDASMESVIPSAPLHRYVTLSDSDRGVTVISDGLAEYEADDAGTLHVTLVRAVGELSRNDLPERPGHAGWPCATPEAQCRGPFGAELALLVHGPWSERTVELVERTAEDVLVPLAGDALRSMVDTPPDVRGVELHGDGLVLSALKESEDGTWTVLRCVNPLQRPVSGRWVLGGPVQEACWSRLDETPGDPVPATEGTIAFEAPPRAVVTLLVR